MILARHILREHIAPFFYALFVITAIFLVDFVVQIMDSILSKGLDWHIVIELFLLNTAWMLALSVPMSVLVATLMAFGRMSADHEIDAMRSAGLHPIRMILPSLGCATLIAVALVWFNNRVLPEANFKAASLREDISRKRPAIMLEPRTMIQDFEGFRVWIQQVDPRTDSLHDILIHQLDRGGAAPTVITARTGVVHLTDAGNTWKFTLHNGETHTPDRAEPRRYARVSFQELVVDVPNIDSRLHRSDKSYRTDREMPIEEMQERVDAARVRESTQIAEQGERLFADVRFVTNLLEVDSASRANAGKPLPDSLRDTATGKRTAKATKSVKDAKTGAPGQKPTTPGGHRIQDSLAHAKAARARDLVQGVHSIQSAIRATADGKTIITPKWKPPDESPSRDLASLVESRQRETRMAKEQIKTEHDEGDRFLVEIHKKFSIPFACIVFVLVGVPLGIMARSGGVGTGVAYSITFFVLYWVGLIGGEALADRGTIEPVVAMWGPNVILGALGVFLISRMGREVQFFRYRWLLDPLRRLGFRKKPT